MHIDPETGDYAQPYVIRKYLLDVTEVQNAEGGDSAVEKLVADATKTLPALDTTKLILPDDDFDATPDGAYSLDRREVSVADSSIKASLVVELSLPMSDDEREFPAFEFLHAFMSPFAEACTCMIASQSVYLLATSTGIFSFMPDVLSVCLSV